MKLVNFIKNIFNKNFWVKNYPYDKEYNCHDEDCFLCNKTTCKGCPVA